INGYQFGIQGCVAALVELAHPGIGQRLARMGFNHSSLTAHGLADEVTRALLLADAPARFVEHGAQHAVGDGFAVHQHPITVKKHSIKSSHESSSAPALGDAK